MTLRIGAALVAALLVAPNPLVAADPMDELKKEKAKLKGTWVVQSFETDGKQVDELKGMMFVFNGNEFTSKALYQVSANGTYKLNPSKKLKEIDLVVDRGGGLKTTTRAVYTCEGDELKIYAAVSEVGRDARGRVVDKPGERPKATDGKAGAVITLTREKK
jgi:uncharacterized protein (TIGR03067 family)